MNVFTLALLVLWIVAFAFQYGWGIAALNSSQESIICPAGARAREGVLGLETCLRLTTWDFGLITTMFNVGGFVSALNAGRLIDRGKKRTILIGSWLVIAGGLLMSFGTARWMLVLSRFCTGLAAGLATVVVPVFLSAAAQSAPESIRGSIGIMCQLSICIGILVVQAVSIPLSEPVTGKWRWIPVISMAVAGAQILTVGMVKEDPNEDAMIYDVLDAERGAFGHEDSDDEEGLAPERVYRSPGASPSRAQTSMSLGEVWSSKDPAVKHGLKVAILSQFFQQMTGINSVMFFSVAILSTVSPGSAKQVALMVTAINVLMTFPPIYLIERLGRRTLLLGSLSSLTVALVVLGWSINNGYTAVAAVAIIGFVACFSIGMGPTPFVLAGEVPPVAARAASASAGLATNWGLNIFIGLLFLPLRDWISGGREDGAGSIFYMFAVISTLGCVVLGKLLAPRG